MKTDTQTVRVDGFQLNPAKVRGVALVPPVNVQLLTLIGSLTLSWGMFEAQFNDFLAALRRCKGLDPMPAYTERRLDVRLRDCKSLAHDCLAKAPEVARYLAATLDAAHSLHPLRNVIVHGDLSFRAYLRNSSVTQAELRFRGSRRGKVFVQAFTEGALDDLYYEIADIGGRMATLCGSSDMLKDVQQKLFPAADVLALGDFLNAHFSERNWDAEA